MSGKICPTENELIMLVLCLWNSLPLEPGWIPRIPVHVLLLAEFSTRMINPVCPREFIWKKLVKHSLGHVGPQPWKTLVICQICSWLQAQWSPGFFNPWDFLAPAWADLEGSRLQPSHRKEWESSRLQGFRLGWSSATWGKWLQLSLSPSSQS